MWCENWTSLKETAEVKCVRSVAGCTLCTCTTRKMKDELITYILNETIVHYSVGARRRNTHEDWTTHTFRPAATSSKLRLYYAVILGNTAISKARNCSSHHQTGCWGPPSFREPRVKWKAVSHLLSVRFGTNGAVSLLPLFLHSIHGNDCTASNGKNMTELISDTSATWCVTLLEVTFLKNENNNMAVVPNF